MAPDGARHLLHCILWRYFIRNACTEARLKVETWPRKWENIRVRNAKGGLGCDVTATVIADSARNNLDYG
jgi:hypothetical protein